MQISRKLATTGLVLLFCSRCVSMPPGQALAAPPPPAGDMGDAGPVKAVQPAEPLLTMRAPASLPLVPTAPPKDLYAPDDQPEYNLSCAEFFDLLKQAQPGSVEETLAAIQKVRPKFLSRALYEFETKMAFDGASLLHPRAIVYGGDAKTILNFGGHPKQKGAERIETVCFDDKENKFDFYDIAFPKEAPAPQAIADLTDIEKQAKYVINNGRGQRECKNCHGEPLRPNWDTSSLWPGFYGAADDLLRDRERPDTRTIYNSFESSMWARFQSMPAKTGRYAYVTQELLRPNSDFTVRVSYLNGRRIVGDLKRLGPAFLPHKYEFAKALMCAPKGERRFFRQLTGDTSVGATFSVLPENADATARELFLSSYYDHMQKERRLGAVLAEYGLPSPLPKEQFQELRQYYRRVLDPANELNLDMRLTTVDVDEIMLIRELKKVTDKLDIDIENWSMVRDGGYVHENGLGGDGKVALRLILERPFSEEFLKDDEELAAAIREREAKELKFYADKMNAEVPEQAHELEQAEAKVCGLIQGKIK